MNKTDPTSDPNATIQLDEVADLAEVDLDGAGGDGRGRAVPPPLPPLNAPVEGAAAAPGRPRTLAVVVFLVLLAAAIGAGVKAGLALSGGAAPAAGAPSVSTSGGAAPVPPTTAITIPTIEMSDPPADAATSR